MKVQVFIGKKPNMKRTKKTDKEVDNTGNEPDSSGSNKQFHEIDGIQCYYTNADMADSVMNKRHELEIKIEIYQPQIISIVDSSCNSSILDSEIRLQSF